MDHCRGIDPLVTPYIDGEASAADQAAVAEHLAACPPCRQRAAAEAAVRQVLRTRVEALRCQTPATLRGRCASLGGGRSMMAKAPSTLRSRALPFSMAAALTLALGGIFVYGLTARSSTALAAQLALDHIKCFALFGGTRPVDSGAMEISLQKRYGWPLHIPEGSGPDGLQLVGARRCLYGEGALAHLMYRLQGRPISLFMLPGAVRPSEMVGALGHQAVIWSGAGRTFVLVGSEPRVELERIAAYLSKRVE